MNCNKKDKKLKKSNSIKTSHFKMNEYLNKRKLTLIELTYE